MSFQVLVSTMQQKGHGLLEKMKITSNAVIVNQGFCKSLENLTFENNLITWINSPKRGLSMSRNMAIQNATANICLLADDDEVFVDHYERIILEQFENNPDYDIIAFQAEGIEEKFKNYHPKTRDIGYLYSMKISSVEIAFRLKRIKEKGIKFNELFGAGAKYFAGEENIFLFECLRKGLKIKYVPVKIADLHIGDSSWFKGYNKEYFIAKGAIFTAMSKAFSILFILQFAIRKRELFRDELSITEAVKFMFKGRKEYLNLK
ncbi:MAG: glycosyltransferase family 2 protein [Clostridiaceae bacterium]|nr:glycosyltransferase family 2 protein [Clostridiaceae bacterium]